MLKKAVGRVFYLGAFRHQDREELPKPAVTAEEYQLKDQLLRTTVDNIEKKVDRIDQRLEKMEERLMR